MRTQHWPDLALVIVVVNWILHMVAFHHHYYFIRIIILIIALINIDLYHLQKGAVHIALVTTAPPPKIEAAVPMPEHWLKNTRKSTIALTITNVSPSKGSTVWAASADVVKRTAPPPMIPKPLAARKTLLFNLTTKSHLQGSPTCMLRREEGLG